MKLSDYKNKKRRANGNREMSWTDIAWELRNCIEIKSGNTLEEKGYLLRQWAAAGAEITGRKGQRKITLEKVLAEEGGNGD